MKNKILITGTGRTGTSILVKLFTYLGMDTGFTNEEINIELNKDLNKKANAGLEKGDLNQDIRIHKAPCFAERIDEILSNHAVEHVIIPIRNLKHTAKSRENLSPDCGGFFGDCKTYKEQMIYNAMLLHNLIESLERNQINYTMLHFPKFLYEYKILYTKLEWLFAEYDVTPHKYATTMDAIVDFKKIHFKV